jgi:hypothetical protein
VKRCEENIGFRGRNLTYKDHEGHGIAAITVGRGRREKEK